MHVFADLKPYICTFADCKFETAQFPTRAAWADHEFSSHRIRESWRCPECSQKLLSPLEWGSHLQRAHQRIFSGAKLQIALDVASEKQSRSTESEECPLCLIVLEKPRRAFVKHAGRHMEEIALMSLPCSAEDDTDEELTNTDSVVSEKIESVEIDSNGRMENLRECPCGGKSDEDMIECDRDQSPTGWLHRDCVASFVEEMRSEKREKSLRRGIEEPLPRISKQDGVDIQACSYRKTSSTGNPHIGTITDNGMNGSVQIKSMNKDRDISRHSRKAFPSTVNDRLDEHSLSKDQLRSTRDLAHSHAHRQSSTLFSLDDRAGRTSHTGDSFADWLFEPDTEKGFLAVQDTAGGRSESRKTCGSPDDYLVDHTGLKAMDKKEEDIEASLTMLEHVQPEYDARSDSSGQTYTPTSRRISKAKKCKKFYACTFPGCVKVGYNARPHCIQG